MTLEERIKCLGQLGDYIRKELEQELQPVIAQSIVENPWFTPKGVKSALSNVSDQYLSESHLISWAKRYTIKDAKDAPRQRIGLVLAGNIPMVGIHDVICVFISGHIAHIKYSSKDKVLIKRLIKEMSQIDSRTSGFFSEVEKLSDIDAVIATGGDTAATHFEYYFSKYPHVIRKNRSSIAILTGKETTADLKMLGQDIFTYFGLGCRNVSKVFVPRGYDFANFFESIIDFSYVIDHNKYKNNYDYTHAIYLLGQHPFLTNNFLIIKEDESLSSRISCLHYEVYDHLDQVEPKVMDIKDQLQCIASSVPLKDVEVISLGNCQSPSIHDYADGVDTMDFLTGLHD